MILDVGKNLSISRARVGPDPALARPYWPSGGWPGPEGQGQGQQKWPRPGPARPLDSVVEMSSSGGFWMKLRLFSTFWQFPMESADSGRVLKAVTMAVGAGDSVGGFDSKTARKITLFWSLVTGTRSCGELAIVGVAAVGNL